MFFFNPMYLIFILPGVFIALWAQLRLRTAYATGKQYASPRGLSGAETAARILHAQGIGDVVIERGTGFLGDHYDPRARVLRLSPEVFDGRSLTAMGIAAHEVGHAIQHSQGYAPLALRSTLVPAASVGTNLAWFCIMIGLMLQPFRWLTPLGLMLFGLFVLFELVTLPVEYDASRRARAALIGGGMVNLEEDRIVGRVLNAAALTYVAAAITAILQLLYYMALASRRNN